MGFWITRVFGKDAFSLQILETSYVFFILKLVFLIILNSVKIHASCTVGIGNVIVYLILIAFLYYKQTEAIINVSIKFLSRLHSYK